MGRKKKIDKSLKIDCIVVESDWAVFRQIPAMLCSDIFKVLLDGPSTSIRGNAKLGVRRTDSFNKSNVIIWTYKMWKLKLLVQRWSGTVWRR